MTPKADQIIVRIDPEKGSRSLFGILEAAEQIGIQTTAKSYVIHKNDLQLSFDIIIFRDNRNKLFN